MSGARAYLKGRCARFQPSNPCRNRTIGGDKSHKIQIKNYAGQDVTLTDREKMAIIVAQAMTLYSMAIQEGKTPKSQSIIDFVLENTPKNFRANLTMELIDEIYAFIAGSNMELS